MRASTLSLICKKSTDLEGKLKEDLMMARIREAENTQCVAELTQRISNLEYKNQELVAEGDLTTSISESDRMREATRPSMMDEFNPQRRAQADSCVAELSVEGDTSTVIGYDDLRWHPQVGRRRRSAC